MTGRVPSAPLPHASLQEGSRSGQPGIVPAAGGSGRCGGRSPAPPPSDRIPHRKPSAKPCSSSRPNSWIARLRITPTAPATDSTEQDRPAVFALIEVFQGVFQPDPLRHPGKPKEPWKEALPRPEQEGKKDQKEAENPKGQSRIDHVGS